MSPRGPPTCCARATPSRCSSATANRAPSGASGPMLGAWEDSHWRPETLGLEPGDVLVLYTDGVTDACGESGRFGE